MLNRAAQIVSLPAARPGTKRSRMPLALWCVGGAVAALLLVTLLVQWAWALGRSDLYAGVLAFRLDADSLSRLCRAAGR